MTKQTKKTPVATGTNGQPVTNVSIIQETVIAIQEQTAEHIATIDSLNEAVTTAQSGSNSNEMFKARYHVAGHFRMELDRNREQLKDHKGHAEAIASKLGQTITAKTLNNAKKWSQLTEAQAFKGLDLIGYQQSVDACKDIGLMRYENVYALVLDAVEENGLARAPQSATRHFKKEVERAINADADLTTAQAIKGAWTECANAPELVEERNKPEKKKTADQILVEKLRAEVAFLKAENVEYRKQLGIPEVDESDALEVVREGDHDRIKAVA